MVYSWKAFQALANWFQVVSVNTFYSYLRTANSYYPSQRSTHKKIVKPPPPPPLPLPPSLPPLPLPRSFSSMPYIVSTLTTYRHKRRPFWMLTVRHCCWSSQLESIACENVFHGTCPSNLQTLCSWHEGMSLGQGACPSGRCRPHSLPRDRLFSRSRLVREWRPPSGEDPRHRCSHGESGALWDVLHGEKRSLINYNGIRRILSLTLLFKDSCSNVLVSGHTIIIMPMPYCEVLIIRLC